MADEAASPLSFRRLQLPIQTALLDKGHTISHALASVFASEVDSEARLSALYRRLAKSSLAHEDVPGTSLGSALEHFKKYTNYMGQQHSIHAYQLDHTVRRPFETGTAIVAEKVLRAKVDLKKLNDKISAKESQLRRAKGQHKKSVQDLRTCREKLAAANADVEIERKKEALDAIGQAPDAANPSDPASPATPVRPAQDGEESDLGASPAGSSTPGSTVEEDGNSALMFGFRNLNFSGKPALEIAKENVQKQRVRLLRANQSLQRGAENVAKAKRELLELLAERDTKTMEALKVFQGAETYRREATREAVVSLCELEQKHLEARLESVKVIRGHFERVSAEDDVDFIIKSLSHPSEDAAGEVLQCSKALDILQWDWDRRQQEHLRAQQSRQEKEVIAMLDEGPEAAEHMATEGSEATQVDKMKGQEPSEGHGSDEASAQLGGSTRNERLVVPTPARLRSEKTFDYESGRIATETLLKKDDRAAKIESIETLSANMASSDCRAAFCETLNALRAECCDLTQDAPAASGGADLWEMLQTLFMQYLDECAKASPVDVGAARHLMNMANTYYRRVERDADSAGQANANGREYLHVECAQHEIWTSEQFWEDALLVAVGEQLAMNPSSSSWDEIVARKGGSNGKDLREEIQRVHNSVFGQLGSLAFYMLEVGVPEHRMLSFVATMCNHCQLGEEQSQELWKSLALARQTQETQSGRSEGETAEQPLPLPETLVLRPEKYPVFMTPEDGDFADQASAVNGASSGGQVIEDTLNSMASYVGDLFGEKKSG